MDKWREISNKEQNKIKTFREKRIKNTHTQSEKEEKENDKVDWENETSSTAVKNELKIRTTKQKESGCWWKTEKSENEK